MEYDGTIEIDTDWLKENGKKLTDKYHEKYDGENKELNDDGSYKILKIELPIEDEKVEYIGEGDFIHSIVFRSKDESPIHISATQRFDSNEAIAIFEDQMDKDLNIISKLIEPIVKKMNKIKSVVESINGV